MIQLLLLWFAYQYGMFVMSPIRHIMVLSQINNANQIVWFWFVWKYLNAWTIYWGGRGDIVDCFCFFPQLMYHNCNGFDVNGEHVTLKVIIQFLSPQNQILWIIKKKKNAWIHTLRLWSWFKEWIFLFVDGITQLKR
jgi:hypothetical protein